MIGIASIDLTGLGVMMNRFETELGKTKKQVTEETGARLLKDLVDASPPKDLEKAKLIAGKDVRRVFAQVPPDRFTGKKKGKGSIQWLIAGPRFLIGVDKEKLLRGNSNMAQVYSDNPNGRLGNKFEHLGTRGGHHVESRGIQGIEKINRYLVSRAALNRFTKQIQDKFGKMKAGWAIGWDRLNVKGRLPKWVKKHLSQGYALGAITLSADGIEILNKAHGVEGEASLRAVKAAVKKRYFSMKADLENQLKGLYKR